MDIQGKLQFYQMQILMPFLYLLRKNNNLAIPRSQSHWYIDHQNHHYIFLGDFNINTFEGVRASKEVFSKFNLKVSKPTHLDSALLDYLYIKKSFENDKHVTSIVNNVYFSDHDAVKVQIRFKDNNPGGMDFNITDWMLLHKSSSNNVMSFT